MARDAYDCYGRDELAGDFLGGEILPASPELADDDMGWAKNLPARNRAVATWAGNHYLERNILKAREAYMILEKFRLDGKVAIVTGSSTGLGQGMCIGLAEAGADIVGVDYVSSAETAGEIEKRGRRFLDVVADLRTIEPIQGIVDRAVSEFGHIDILVNNAGIIRREDALQFTERDWDEVMDLNAKTVFFFSQAVARRFVAQGKGGKIINIASMLSFQGGIRVPSYTASKSAVMGLTRLLANEWAKYRINVNAIAPGYMATNNTAQLRADPNRSQEILGRIPAGRWGTPEDVQGAAVFLASEASEYVNGYTIAVDGGWLAR